jgi:hypothetical protein
MKEALAWTVYYIILTVIYTLGFVVIHCVAANIWWRTDGSYTECKYAANMWAFNKTIGG